MDKALRTLTAGFLFVLAGCGGGPADEPAASAQRRQAAPTFSAATCVGSDTGCIDQVARALAHANPSVEPQATATLDTETFFNWVPTRYATHFSGAYEAGVSGAYTYRYYPATRNYLAVSGADVYVLGPVSAGVLQKVGPLSQFACTVLPASCEAAPAPTAPSLPAAALAGMYLGDTSGASPNSLWLVAGSGRFYGSNVSPSPARVDYFAGNLSVSGATFSSNGAYFGQVSQLNNRGSTADIAGSFVAGASLNATFTVHAGPFIGNRFNLYYYPSSSLTSSLSRVGGRYTASSAGMSININSTTGAISGTSNHNCNVSGVIAVLDPAKNIYPASITMTGSGCSVTGVFDMLAHYYVANNGEAALLLLGSASGSVATSFLLLSFPRVG